MKRLLKRTDLASAAALCARERTRYAFDCVEIIFPRKGYRLCATDGKEAVRMVSKQHPGERAFEVFDDTTLVTHPNPGGRYALVDGVLILDALKICGTRPEWILVEITRRQVRLAAPLHYGGAAVVLENQKEGLTFPNMRPLLQRPRRIRLAFNPGYVADIGKIAEKHQGKKADSRLVQMRLDRSAKRRAFSAVAFHWKADETEVDALLMPVSR